MLNPIPVTVNSSTVTVENVSTTDKDNKESKFDSYNRSTGIAYSGVAAPFANLKSKNISDSSCVEVNGGFAPSMAVEGFDDTLNPKEKKLEKLKKEGVNLHLTESELSKYAINNIEEMRASEYINEGCKIKWCFSNNTFYVASFLKENEGILEKKKAHHVQLARASSGHKIFCAGELKINSSGLITCIDNNSSYHKGNVTQANVNLDTLVALLKEKNLTIPLNCQVNYHSGD